MRFRRRASSAWCGCPGSWGGCCSDCAAALRLAALESACMRGDAPAVCNADADGANDAARSTPRKTIERDGAEAVCWGVASDGLAPGRIPVPGVTRLSRASWTPGINALAGGACADAKGKAAMLPPNLSGSTCACVWASPLPESCPGLLTGRSGEELRDPVKGSMSFPCY